jgi:hypothetical protein
VEEQSHEQLANNLDKLTAERQELLEALAIVEKDIAKLQKICKTEESFKQNLFELIETSYIKPDETLLNSEMIQLRKFANHFEQNKPKIPPAPNKDHLEH